MTTTFASDNYSSVDPAVLAYLAEINRRGHAPSYDGDEVTAQARDALRRLFDCELDALFVSTGTAANILGLKLLIERPYDAVLSSSISHVYADETGALPVSTGAQLFPLPHRHGKITVAELDREVSMRKALGEHSALPKVVSIANSTEVGTVYRPEEVSAIAEYCHGADLFLHVDGCRLPNAAVALGCDLADLSSRAGVDVLSFGGAKNGLMNAEAVVIFRAPPSSHMRMQKQVMQLTSKVRYVSGQFIPYVEGDLWSTNARRANALAVRLADALTSMGVELTRPFETNQIFCTLAVPVREGLRARGHRFYDWHAPDEVRLVTSWDSADGDVAALIHDLAELT